MSGVSSASRMGAALLRRRPNQSLRRRRGRMSWIRERVVRKRLRRSVSNGSDGTCAFSDRWGFSAGTGALRGRSQYASKAPAARGGLRTASRGGHADRPFDEPATSTARRIAAATWMMSRTTVASRAYAAVPARRSRCSPGASRTSSAPAAGSAQRRADAGRGAARRPGCTTCIVPEVVSE